MSGCNQAHLQRRNSSLRRVHAMNLVIPDVKTCDFSALDNIYPEITCCLRISPGHPVMFGNTAPRLVSCTMNRVPDIRADIDDGHQFLDFLWSKPLTIDAIKRTRI